MLHATADMIRIDPPASPLVLCDRLLTLAQEVDRAGLRTAAETLLELSAQVLEPVRRAPRGVRRNA